MKHIFLFIVLLISTLTYSQEIYNSESFRVTLEDIQARTFKKDSTANALVLYEQGNSFVDKNDYDLRTEVKRKLKILNQEGFDHATVTLYLYKGDNSEVKVKDLVATTYNEVSGKVIKSKLLDKNIFREKYDEDYTLVKFTLPNIKEGSVITYSYTRISPFMFKYRGWDFQSDIPKLYSEYKTSIPANWLYNIKLVGEKKLTVNTSEVKKKCLEMSNGASADCSENVYAMKDVPAFIEEDYMTTRSNYLARIEYELKTFKGMDGSIKNYTKTWKDVDKEFKTDKEVGRQLRKKVELEDHISVDIINEINALKKAKSIYTYIQNNYTWNGDYDIFDDVSIKNLVKNKSGNVSSINILLHNILNEAGIKVTPVLVSTRDNGFPTTIYPVISDFNYLIVQAIINENTYLLDATDKNLSFGEIPFRCLNGQGRLMDFKNGSEWIDLKPPKVSNTQYMASLSFDANQNIIGKVKSKSTGYASLRKRKSYYSNSNNYIEELENINPNIEINDFEVTSSDKTDPNFLESYNVEYIADNTGDNIYINPFFIVYYSNNPFKLQERTYPIDFGYTKSFLYILTMDVGDNYDIVETPKNAIFALPNKEGLINLSSKVVGSKINIILKFNFKLPLYHQEYYPYLKAYVSKIIEIQNNSLILLKKK
ncbi:MAG: DUF3857 domain-containing protein [Algibacter sp.]